MYESHRQPDTKYLQEFSIEIIENTSHDGPLWWESTGHWWIRLTNG